MIPHHLIREISIRTDRNTYFPIGTDRFRFERTQTDIFQSKWIRTKIFRSEKTFSCKLEQRRAGAPDLALQPSQRHIDKKEFTRPEFEGPRDPNQRLTEIELRELLNSKERELIERQRAGKEKRKFRFGDTELTDLDTPADETDSGNEYEKDSTVRRGSGSERSRISERKKPLTEQELSDVLIQRAKKLMDAEKRRHRDYPEKHSDRGLGLDR